jgi:serine/threonine protein kinase/tetratricopeptide (TPR) repeat protein
MTLAQGTKLGRYEIRSQLGAGGMGEVYLAVDTELDRTVAIKILPSALAADQQRLHRFIQEAKAASALNHPHILTIYEIGTTGTSRFIATEFIDGDTLRQRINAGMKLVDILEISIQIGSALAAAHTVGIIHRDLKPENVMIRRDGFVKLLDFGLAKLSQPDGSLTDTEAPTKAMVNTAAGTVMGTANYMSPEQAKGINVDTRTDLWSVGAVLYEMITGHLPFAGDTTTETISLILQKEPAPLTRYTNEAPAELERIVTKALTKDREERYQTAKDLALDLRNLKRKLEVDAEIERTVPPEIRTLRSTSGSKVAATATGSEPTAQQSAGPSASSAEYIVSSIKEHKRGAGVVLAALVLVGAGIAYLYSVRTGRSAIDSIAVLPLVNTSADPNAEWLSDGITESIINNLSQLPNLTVIARSSVFRYKGRDVDPQTAARELKVRAALTGRIVQRGDNLSISVELVDTSNHRQIWGQQFNRKMSDLLAMQSEISREISEELRLRLTGEERKRVTKQYTANAEAYQLYLKGRYHWNKRTLEDLKKAIEYFNQAVEKDSNYALAYAGIADCYGVPQIGLSPPEAMPRAKAAAMKALSIDDTLAEAHTSLANVLVRYDWDWSGAEREFKRAIELNPNYPTAHYWYALYLAGMDRQEEALREAQRAHELDPLSLVTNWHVGVILSYVRPYDRAIEQLRKTLELDPNFAGPHDDLGWTYAMMGRFDEAVSEFQTAIKLSGGDTHFMGDLATVYALSGKRGEAQKILDQLTEVAKERYVSPYRMAQIYIALGDRDRAFEWLEKGYRDRSFGASVMDLKAAPFWDPVRSDPRFADLLRRMNLG